MGLESRDYNRDGSYTASLGWQLDFTPVVKYLIIINIVVFLLQIFITRSAVPELADREMPWTNPRRQAQPANSKQKADPDAEQEQEENARRWRENMRRMVDGMPGMQISLVTQWFQLDPKKTIEQGQVWRLVTCAFCHNRLSLLHILFNMIALYWFGIRLERMYGSTEFLLFYLTAAVCSSLAYVALAYRTGSTIPAIGASGAVMGVMLLYTIYYPFETFLCFWCLPIPLWILLGVYVLYDLHPVLLQFSGDHFYTGVAHAGHLGGLLFGLVYWWSDIRLEVVLGRKWRALRLPTASGRRRVACPPPRDLADRVDAVLKKISEQGQESLSEEERKLLIEASARYRGAT